MLRVRGRWAAVEVLALFAGILVSIVVSGSPAVAVPPGCESTGPDEANAAAMAKRCGQRVEVLTGRSETTQVFANPDGSSTFTSSVVPLRVHRSDGSWVPVDTTLRTRPDGSVAPVATVTDMVFSGGGRGPFATYRAKSSTLTVGLPMSLPKPTLTGSTAVYADVLAGLDLRVTASATGFRHVLVVKTAAAAANSALADLRISVGGDVVVGPAGDGRVRFTDGKGRTVAVSEAASMWDSTVDPGSNGEVKASTSRAFLDGLRKAPPAELSSDEHGPGATARSAAVAVHADADGHGVRLTPDAAMVKSAALPLFIDPQIGPGDSTWAYSRSVNSNYAVNGQPWIGVNPPCCGGDGSTFRSFFDFPTSSGGLTYKGKHVLSANFNIVLDHSYSCTPTVANAYRSTGSIYVGNGARMDWGARPLGSGSTWIASAAGNANESGGCGVIQPDLLMTFGNTETMRADVQAVADAHWDVYPIGVCTCDANGANEAAQDRWKRFNVDTSTTMSVTFNSVPGTPANLSPYQGQVACNGIVGTTSPVLTAQYVDDDSQDTLSAVFNWQELPAGPINTVNGPSKPANNNGSVTLNLGAGAEGKTYQFQVRTVDGNDVSPWSPWCQFTVDTTAPPRPVVTPTASGTSPTYTYCDPPAINICTPQGGPGIAGAFTFSEPAGTAGQDVLKYVYGWDSPSTTVTVSPGAASPPISLTPPHYGLNTLLVSSVDGTGHSSSTSVFTILVGDPDGSASAAKAYWPLDSIDGHGFTDQVSGNALTTSGVAWTNDVRYVGAQAATFTATGDATQSVPAFDTSGSFSVAAWVNPAATCANNHTMVSIDADSVAANNHASAFTLNLDCTNMRFTMDVSDQNTATPNHLTALSANGSAVVGRWSFLVGVFDESLNQVQLWVNGVLVQTTTASATWITAHGSGWKATGPVVLGRYLWNNGPGGRFNGAIADVRLWNRGIVADDINGTDDNPATGVAAHLGLANPLEVGSWEFPDGECFCANTPDGSVFSRPLTLSPDFSVDPNADQNPDTASAWLVDGGQDGNGGLRLDGVGGYATTSDDSGTADPGDDTAHPVLRTDQSMTLSGWANLKAITNVDQVVVNAGPFLLFFRGWEHKWGATMLGTGGVNYEAASDAVAQTGAWVHLVGVFDAPAGQVRLYVNGVLQGAIGTGAVGQASTSSLLIGREGPGHYFGGTIDDVHAWQGVLNAREIGNLSGHPITNSGHTLNMDAVDVHRNLVVNGGFNLGSGSWQVWPQTNFATYPSGIVSNDPYEGSQFGATNTTVNGGGIYQDIQGNIVAGDTFCGSAQVATAWNVSGAGGAFVIWGLDGPNGSENSVRYFSNLPGGNQWTQVQTCFTATGPHPAIRVQFYPNANSPTLIMDAVDVHRSLAVNGGFNLPWSWWQAWPQTNYVAYPSGTFDDSYEGSQFAATNTTVNGGGIYQDIPATIGAGDTFCGSAQVATAGNGWGASGTFVIWAIDSSGGSENSGRSFSNLPGGNQWTQVQTCFTATRPAQTIRVQFYPIANSPTLIIDAVDVHRSLAVNGGFNLGLGSWQTWPQTNFTTYETGAVGNSPYEGSRFASTSTTVNGGGIYQDIPANIDAGDTFCGSAQVATQGSGSGAAGTFTIWAVDGPGGTEGSTRAFSNLPGGNQWTPVQTCVTATRAHPSIRVQFYPTAN